MDSLDNKKPSVTTGHEVHGVYLCHRCGWPFPNPHPSSRHRRAHKRVCGTIDGYEIFESKSDDHHLAVSDDEHNSDENEHTPSPKVEKGNAKEFGSDGRVGEKSNKSEEDVFSDAISEFSDSGISPRLEERFERVKGMDKIMENETVEGDLEVELKKVDEAADRTEQLNIPTSSDAMDQSESAISITGARIQPVSVEDSSVSQPNLMKSEVQRDVNVDHIDEHDDKETQQVMAKDGQDTDAYRVKDKLASVVLVSEEGQSLDSSSVAVEEKDGRCDKLFPEVVKYNPSSPTETLENVDATSDAKSGAISAELNESAETIHEIIVAEGTREDINALTAVAEVSDSAEVVGCTGTIDGKILAEDSHLSMSPVKPGGSVQTYVAPDFIATECSDVVSVVSSIDKEIEQKTSLSRGDNALNIDSNVGEKCDTTGIENRAQELKKNISGEIVCADTSYAPVNDQTTGALKEDVNQRDEKDNGTLPEVGTERDGGAATKAQAIIDSVVQSVNSTDVPSSCEVDGDAKHLEVSKTEFSLIESGDNGAATNAPITMTEDRISMPVNSELPQNIHVTTDVKGMESVDVSEIVSDLKHNGDTVTPERTPELPISKGSAQLKDSEILSKTTANEDTGSSIRIRALESVDAAEVGTEINHSDNVVILIENSVSPTLETQEALSLSQKSLKETSPEGFTSEDANKSKSVDIALVAEKTCNGSAISSEKCPNNPVLDEPVLSPSDAQVIHESSGTGNDASVDSKPLQDEGGVKLTKEKDGVSAIDLPNDSVSRSDSLEGKCGSISDISETNLQEPKTVTEAANPDKSESFEAPSFMTLVQPGTKVDDKATAGPEIEMMQNHQQPKSDALQVGWFPSLTNVVNESEGRKKNEEIIAKVTNWNQGKQHGPLKNLLNEAKSPNTKQVPAANQKDEPAVKDNGAAVTTVGSVLGNEATNKEAADKEWDSPARYPTEIKKEKKKGKTYWVPFVCCSSVHRDL